MDAPWIRKLLSLRPDARQFNYRVVHNSFQKYVTDFGMGNCGIIPITARQLVLFRKRTSNSTLNIRVNLIRKRLSCCCFTKISGNENDLEDIIYGKK